MIDNKPLVRVLVVGLGNMGVSHALAYHNNPGYEIIGLVNRSPVNLPGVFDKYPQWRSFEEALTETKPDLVSINTYSDSHAEYAIASMDAGAHVFLEKPIATNVADAKQVVKRARSTGRKLVIGYILRHHPSWVTLVEKARELGGPYVFRLNLNQQSSGPTWATHKALMESTPPIVDCGVHYVDVMCQITDAKPVKVRGMGLRLSDELRTDSYNYGHFQVIFDDGSVGWYEAGWGPMMSETAFFVKDIISPNGSVSIIMPDTAKSDDINTHTQTSILRLHKARTDNEGNFCEPDTDFSMEDEPGHDELCAREQQFMLRSIREDLDLNAHMRDAVLSLQICLAADESVRTGREINL